MGDIKITERETLSDWKDKLEKVEYGYVDKNGHASTATREIYWRGACAAILLVDSERQMVLLTKQFRLPVYLNNDTSGELIECCAGMIDEGEVPEQTIVREVEEELGYRISEIQPVGSAYTSPAAVNEYIHLFIGKYNPDLKIASGGGKESEGEKITPVELSFAEVREQLKAARFQDLKTITLLQKAILLDLI